MTRQTAAINLGPGHDRPERVRACLLTGEVVAAAAAHYASYRPRLGETSRRAIESAARPHAPSADSGPAGSPDTADARETTGTALWLALCQAPDEGTDVTELTRMTGWTRTRLYRHQGDRPEATPRPRQLAPVPPPRDPADANPTPERPRLAEPMPVRDAIAECVAELVDQAPELSPRIADKLIRIITGHQH